MCDVDNHLVASSMFFITNAVSAYLYDYYLYSFLFGMLTLTSILYHTTTNFYTNILDKCAIVSVVVYGTYLVYRKQLARTPLILVVSSFVTCIVFFYYGYYTNRFCYHPDKTIGNVYHSLLHIISCIGHHCIVLL